MVVKINKPAVNVREELAYLRKPTGIAGQAMLAAETPQEQQALIGVGRRNLLINSDFKVSQRGTYTTATSASTAYFLDRWLVDRNGSATVQHTSGHDLQGTPAICKAVKLVQTSTSTSNYLGIRQKIENPTQYRGRDVTYSAWVKSNTSSTRIEWFAQGTNQSAIGPNHSGSGEWEFLSFTAKMTGNPSTAWNIDVFIDSGAYGNTLITAGDYFEVTMLQLEIGKIVTPYEFRSYGEELAACQRYYFQKVSGTSQPLGIATYKLSTQVRLNVDFPTSMRAAPSVITSNGTNHFRAENSVDDYFNGNWVLLQSSFSGALIYSAASVSGTQNTATAVSSNSSGARLAFNSEL